MKRLRIFFRLYLFVLITINVSGQKLHSHNDYEQQKPFFMAHDLGFDSIEADIFLKENELFVAHNFKDIRAENTFQKLYLEPILQKIKENKGFPYKNKKRLQLLIDLKTEGKSTMDILYEQLKPYKKALKNVKIVISGNMPKPEEFENYDKMFFFDGRKNLVYSKKQWKRIGIMSASFADFSKNWDGKEKLSAEVSEKINQFVKENHQKNKEVRLWGTPNTVLAYETLKQFEIDFIGTDDLKLLKEFQKILK